MRTRFITRDLPWLVCAILPAIMAISIAPNAQAVPITMDAVGRGFYHADGSTNGNNLANNYVAGKINNVLYRNWFNFDLSGVSGTVTSADFLIDAGLIVGPDHDYELHALTTSIASLGTNSAATYTDLGSGTVYGGQTFVSGGIHTITLNNDALADLNAALGGNFAFGGSITSPLTQDPDVLFGGTSGTTASGKAASITQLRLTTAAIPEPSTVVLMGLGLVGLGYAGRRKLVG